MAIGKTSANSGKDTPINRQIGGTVIWRKIPAQTDDKNTGRDGTCQIKQIISPDIQLAGIALPQGTGQDPEIRKKQYKPETIMARR